MKVRTHVRMTLDVLEAWKDVLGFDPEDFVEAIENANRYFVETWSVHTRDGRSFPMPHHRTERRAHHTAEAVRVHAIIARDMWLGFTEGRIRRSEENLREFVAHLAAAMHFAQDFCTWSKPRQKHDAFEAKVDELYERMRKKLRGKKYGAKRSKIYNTYWTLMDGALSTTNNPKKYIKEAYKRSSELVSFVTSERRLDRKYAESLLKKYGEYFPETLEEVRYWDRGVRGLFRLASGIFLVILVYKVLTGEWVGNYGGWMGVFYGSLYLLSGALAYVVSKLAEFKNNGRKYDIIPDAAELVAFRYRGRYFRKDARPSLSPEKVRLLRQDYYIG